MGGVRVGSNSKCKLGRNEIDDGEVDNDEDGNNKVRKKDQKMSKS